MCRPVRKILPMDENSLRMQIHLAQKVRTISSIPNTGILLAIFRASTPARRHVLARLRRTSPAIDRNAFHARSVRISVGIDLYRFSPTNVGRSDLSHYPVPGHANHLPKLDHAIRPLVALFESVVAANGACKRGRQVGTCPVEHSPAMQRHVP